MTSTSSPTPAPAVNLTKFAWLAIAAALVTIGLKAGAWWFTGSVGLLSDALESSVNLVAAIVALIALTVAASPADKGHHYGHGKAEYFSAFIEGLMIFAAAVMIIWTSIDRLLHPQPIDNIGVGLLISVLAGIVNGAVSWVLLRAGRAHRSATLIADAKHLFTDVLTSVGVVIGVALVFLTKLWWLDPIVALLVGLNIIWTGYKLVQESARALMDESMSEEENAELQRVLAEFVVPDTVAMHALRTRVSGRNRFAEVHVLVPGSWTVAQGHDLCHKIEAAAEKAFEGLHLACHLEPIDDPRAWSDIPVASLDVEPEPDDAPPTPR